MNEHSFVEPHDMIELSSEIIQTLRNMAPLVFPSLEPATSSAEIIPTGLSSGIH